MKSSRRFSKDGNKNDLWVAELKTPDGKTLKAMVKPRPYGDGSGWNRTPMERVAYVLNRSLGMDYVPPVEYRKDFNLADYHVYEGALIYKVPEARILHSVPRDQWGISPEGVFSDNRVLCVLLQNPDAHARNLYFGKHWADGIPRPVFLDFGASLKKGESITMTSYPKRMEEPDIWKENTDSIYRVRQQTLRALKRLGREDFDSLKEFLSEQEIDDILSRRNGIVQYFERLIKENGYEKTVIQD